MGAALKETSPIPVVILGALGTSVNMANLINSDPQKSHRVVGWCVDCPAVGTVLEGLPVVANRASLKDYLDRHPEVRLLFNMYKQGQMEQRFALLTSLELPDAAFTNYVSSRAFVSEGVDLGVGNVVFPQVSIAAGVQLGRFNIINYNVVIEHDTRLGQGNFLASGCIIGSGVVLEACNFIGLGARIRENNVLSHVLVGMGSVVLQDCHSCTVIGTPARPLGER